MRLYVFQEGGLPDDRDFEVAILREQPVLKEDYNGVFGTYVSCEPQPLDDYLCAEGLAKVLGIRADSMPRVGEYIELEVKIL